MEMTADMIALGQDYFEHHGIQGQKWGVRRFQNDDGSLTEAGRKRYYKSVASNKEATLLKGQSVYRISSNDKSDATGGKIYVSASPESGDFYKTNAVGSGKIYKDGKAFVQEYVLNSDLKMPDKKTMEKIELQLLKDPDVQKELVDSLMKKGLSREQATEMVKPYSAGTAAGEKVGNAMLALAGIVLMNPVVTTAGIAAMTGDSAEKNRALSVTRSSYGDVDNKILNEKLRNELKSKGYNAIKDYNDRRAFGKKGEHAVIILDSDKNLTFKKADSVTEKSYGESYARQYLKDHPKSKLSYQDLVSDGEKRYRDLYNQGVLDRRKKKEDEDYLRKNGGIVKHSLTLSWSNTRWNSYNFDELYHSGVKKQKWGLRRWQYEDGSLTPAGREHYRKLRLKAMAKGQSADIKKGLTKKSDVEEKPKQKSVENMTDAELKKATNRLALEDAYYQKQKNIAVSKAEIKKNTPEQKSLGKKFTEKLMNDVIVPAVTNAGKDYVEKYLKNLGDQSLSKKFSKNDKNKK